MIADLLDERSCLESTAVGQVRFNDDTVGQRHSFERLLGSDCFNSRETHLMLQMHEPSAVVHKNTSPLEGARCCFTVGFKHPTQKP